MLNLLTYNFGMKNDFEQGGIVPLKGLSGFFPKCFSYSVKGVDEGGWPQQPKVFFFSKLPYLQMPALQSWSGCQPVLLQAGSKYSYIGKCPYVPIDLTLAVDFLTTGWEFRDTR